MEGKGPRVEVSGLPGRGGSQVWQLGQRWPGDAGDGQGGGPQPLKKEGSRDRGRGLARLDARDSSSPMSVCPGGSRGQEAHEKEASPCRGRTGYRGPVPSPALKAREITASGEEGEGARPACPGQGASCLPEPKGTRGRSQGLPAPEGPLALRVATPSWVFGRLGNSSKR